MSPHHVVETGRDNHEDRNTLKFNILNLSETMSVSANDIIMTCIFLNRMH